MRCKIPRGEVAVCPSCCAKAVRVRGLRHLGLYHMGATLERRSELMWTGCGTAATTLRMSQIRLLRGLLAVGAVATCTWSFNAEAAEAQFELDLGSYDDVPGDGTSSPTQATGKASWSTIVVDGSGNQVLVTFVAGAQGSYKPTLTFDPTDSSLGVTSAAPTIKGSSATEIDEWEYLTVNFATVQGSALPVEIVDAVLVNLYEDESRLWGWVTYSEVGGFKVNGTTSTVVGTQSSGQGIYTASINQVASSITFLVPTSSTNGGAGLGSNALADLTQDNDFAVRGLSWNSIGGKGVPELSGRGAAAPVILLAGVAFAGLSQRRRRTIAAQ